MAHERRRKNYEKRRGMSLESLESREMFAADWSLASGILTIHADDNGSQVQVTDTNPAIPNSALVLSTQSNDADWAIGLPKNAVQELRFYGSDSDDSFVNSSMIASRIYGYGGDDQLIGGTNTDRIYGQNGDDRIKGNGGKDYLFGGFGDDTIFGGAGNDFVYGQGGNDQLLGGDGNDFISGGSGRDGLFGGWGTDTINGGKGPDRVLRHVTDIMNLHADFAAEDVNINFADAGWVLKSINGSLTVFQAGQWSEEDVLQIDIGLDLLASRTGNNALLQDVDGGELSFYRHGNATTFPLDGNASYTAYNAGGDMYFSDIVFSSEDRVVRTVIHEIAHNWDSAEEVEVRLPGQGEAIIEDGFRHESFWVAGNGLAAVHPAFLESSDGNWSYLVSAAFARDYGRTNPSEDFATAFAAYFMDLDGRPYVSGSPAAAAIPGKIEHIEILLDELSELEFEQSSLSTPQRDSFASRTMLTPTSTVTIQLDADAWVGLAWNDFVLKANDGDSTSGPPSLPPLPDGNWPDGEPLPEPTDVDFINKLKDELVSALEDWWNDL